MAEIKGYIYEEIKNLAYQKKCDAQNKYDRAIKKELDKAKEEVEKELIPEIKKVAKIKVNLSDYGSFDIKVEMPDDKLKSFKERYEKRTSSVRNKIGKEKTVIENKYRDWLCDFAKNANEGVVIDLPKFD